MRRPERGCFWLTLPGLLSLPSFTIQEHPRKGGTSPRDFPQANLVGPFSQLGSVLFPNNSSLCPGDIELTEGVLDPVTKITLGEYKVILASACRHKLPL